MARRGRQTTDKVPCVKGPSYDHHFINTQAKFLEARCSSRQSSSVATALNDYYKAHVISSPAHAISLSHHLHMGIGNEIGVVNIALVVLYLLATRMLVYANGIARPRNEGLDELADEVIHAK